MRFWLLSYTVITNGVRVYHNAVWAGDVGDFLVETENVYNLIVEELSENNYIELKELLT